MKAALFMEDTEEGASAPSEFYRLRWMVEFVWDGGGPSLMSPNYGAYGSENWGRYGVIGFPTSEKAEAWRDWMLKSGAKSKPERYVVIPVSKYPGAIGCLVEAE